MNSKPIKMPALFLGHGNPMNVLKRDNPFNQGFARVAQTFAKPKAVLMVSAHWYGASLELTAAARPGLVYDFYGFPSELYQVDYPAQGSSALVARVRELLSDEDVHENRERGFDHGMWTVMKHLYPDADIPVVQLSIDSRLGAQQHFELARKLRPLRDEGVLVAGSGNIVHNLRLMSREHIDQIGTGYAWAFEFAYHINQAVMQGDNDTLTDYLRLGDAAALSVPTPEHYLPLLYAAALRDKGEPVELFNDALVGGSLSMTSVKVG